VHDLAQQLALFTLGVRKAFVALIVLLGVFDLLGWIFDFRRILNLVFDLGRGLVRVSTITAGTTIIGSFQRRLRADAAHQKCNSARARAQVVQLLGHQFHSAGILAYPFYAHSLGRSVLGRYLGPVPEAAQPRSFAFESAVT